MEKETVNITPFWNGSEAISWYENNCVKCTKAYFPHYKQDYPTDESMKVYCSIGKECKLKYKLDLSFVTGELPVKYAERIGFDQGKSLLSRCKEFSQDLKDAYRPKKRQPKKIKEQLKIVFKKEK